MGVAMTNLAIVISVAEYTGELKRLPGCHKDGDAMLEFDSANIMSL